MTMRCRFLVFCLSAAAILVVANPLAAADPPAANLKLLTWNIQMLPTAWDFASGDLRKEQALRAPWIIEYLNQRDYDVVVLEEVIDRKITSQLKEGLKGQYPYIIGPEGKLGISGASGGILFAGKIPLKYLAHIVYKNISGVDKLAEKGCVLVEAERDGVRFQIAGTHLQAGDDTMRDREFAEIRDGIIIPYRQEGVPQLLVGDMNVAATDDAFDLLLATNEMRAFPLDDASPFTVDGKNSWNRANKRPKHIDHVLLNPRGTGTAIVRQTIQRARREHEGKTIDYADHYGVVAEVLVKK